MNNATGMEALAALAKRQKLAGRSMYEIGVSQPLAETVQIPGPTIDPGKSYREEFGLIRERINSKARR